MRRVSVLVLSILTSAGASEPARRPPVLDLHWVRIRSGSFIMGCVATDTACYANEKPRHRVRLSEAFELMAHEVTVGAFRAYAISTGKKLPRQPDWNSPDTHPVINITWTEARDFCTWAGGRLPTEAEWEYAARGGREGAVYPWGDAFDPTLLNGVGQSGTDRWFTTAPVGSFRPNGLGLFDMAGNVWEWVDDWFDPRYYGQSPPVDPRGPASGSLKGVRGGSWDNGPRALRISQRERLSPTGRYNLYVGVRCARSRGQRARDTATHERHGTQ